MPSADAEALREHARDISRQLSAWIQSMQEPGFKEGPRFHQEPDRYLDRFLDQQGLERMPDGRVRKKGEG